MLHVLAFDAVVHDHAVEVAVDPFSSASVEKAFGELAAFFTKKGWEDLKKSEELKQKSQSADAKKQAADSKLELDAVEPIRATELRCQCQHPQAAKDMTLRANVSDWSTFVQQLCDTNDPLKAFSWDQENVLISVRVPRVKLKQPALPPLVVVEGKGGCGDASALVDQCLNVFFDSARKEELDALRADMLNRAREHAEIEFLHTLAAHVHDSARWSNLVKDGTLSSTTAAAASKLNQHGILTPDPARLASWANIFRDIWKSRSSNPKKRKLTLDIVDSFSVAC